MIIYKSDSEEEKEIKRRENERVGYLTYQRRAQSPPTALYQEQQKRGIEQAKIQQEDYDGIQGDTQFTNGEVRNVYLDGASKKFHAFGFAGMCKESFLQQLHDPITDVSLGSNTLAIEAKLRCNKAKEDYKEVERRGGVRPGAGRPKKN